MKVNDKRYKPKKGATGIGTEAQTMEIARSMPSKGLPSRTKLAAQRKLTPKPKKSKVRNPIGKVAKSAQRRSKRGG